MVNTNELNGVSMDEYSLCCVARKIIIHVHVQGKVNFTCQTTGLIKIGTHCNNMKC